MTAQQEDCEAAGRGWACDRVNASDCLDRRVERLQPLRKRTIRDQQDRLGRVLVETGRQIELGGFGEHQDALRPVAPVIGPRGGGAAPLGGQGAGSQRLGKPPGGHAEFSPAHGCAIDVAAQEVGQVLTLVMRSKRAQSNNAGRRFLHSRVSKLWRRWLHRQALIRVFVLPHRPTLSPSGMRKLRANPAPKGLDFLRRLSVAGVLGDAEAGRDRIRKIDARGQLRLGEHTKAH